MSSVKTKSLLGIVTINLLLVVEWLMTLFYISPMIAFLLVELAQVEWVLIMGVLVLKHLHT